MLVANGEGAKTNGELFLLGERIMLFRSAAIRKASRDKLCSSEIGKEILRIPTGRV
jgi:hypothetical protein